MSKKTFFVFVVFVLSIGISSLTVASDIPSLIKDLKDKDKAKDASYALAKIGKPAVPELIKALEGNNTNQKRYAARAIREMGQNGSDAIPALEKLIKDGDTATREYVVEALGNMTQQANQVLPMLEKAREDSNEDVREKAKSSIEKLKNPEGSSEPNEINALETGICGIPFKASVDEVLKWAKSNNMDIANDTEQTVLERVKNKTSKIKQIKRAYEVDKQFFLSEMEKELMEISGYDAGVDILEKEEIKKIQEELSVLKNSSVQYEGGKYYLEQVFKKIEVEIDNRTMYCTDDKITKAAYVLVLRSTEKSENINNNGVFEIEVFFFDSNGQNFLSYATLAQFNVGYFQEDMILQSLTKKYGKYIINVTQDDFTNKEFIGSDMFFETALGMFDVGREVSSKAWDIGVVLSSGRPVNNYLFIVHFNEDIVENILATREQVFKKFEKEYYQKKELLKKQMENDF